MLSAPGEIQTGAGWSFEVSTKLRGSSAHPAVAALLDDGGEHVFGAK